MTTAAYSQMAKHEGEGLSHNLLPLSQRFWIPSYKYQLVEILNKYYPNENWDKKPKRQLEAVYISIRLREERRNVKVVKKDIQLQLF